MNLSALTTLAQLAPQIFGKGLPMEPRTFDPSLWDGRSLDGKTHEAREALSAYRALCQLHEHPETRTSAMVLVWVYVQHGHTARRTPLTLIELALATYPPRKAPKQPLKREVAELWWRKGLVLAEQARKVWEGVQG